MGFCVAANWPRGMIYGIVTDPARDLTPEKSQDFGGSGIDGRRPIGVRSQPVDAVCNCQSPPLPVAVVCNRKVPPVKQIRHPSRCQSSHPTR